MSISDIGVLVHKGVTGKVPYELDGIFQSFLTLQSVGQVRKIFMIGNCFCPEEAWDRCGHRIAACRH